jgi:Fur family peroxide stress response transcriptional regulator
LGFITNNTNRRTKQRAAILGILRGGYCHLTADEIYDEVRKDIPNISKGTVYRNLKVLRELGLVSELNLNDSVSRFEAKRDGHYHFRCERCSRLFDVDEPIDRKLDRRIAEKTGFKISCHQLEFRGLCHECQQK